MLRVRIPVSRFTPSSFIVYLQGFRIGTKEKMSETAKDKGAVATKEKGGAEKRGRGRPRKTQQAVLIHCRSPAVSISKQLSALTRRLVDLEAKVGLLEARLNERSPPPTADKSTATDSPVDVPPTPVEPQTECQQATYIHPSGHGEFSLTNVHLNIVGFASAVSTSCIDHTPVSPADITEDSAYLNHQLLMPDYNYSPVKESASAMSDTSQQCPSEMSSFCLRLPETPRNDSKFQSHNSVRRSPKGVILQDVTLNHVSMELETTLCGCNRIRRSRSPAVPQRRRGPEDDQREAKTRQAPLHQKAK
ncbi:uncharacterized protein LOC113648235 [Tachysurus ichikawai]